MITITLPLRIEQSVARQAERQVMRVEHYARGALCAWSIMRVEHYARGALCAWSIMRVEHYARQPDGTWLLTDVSGPDGEIVLASVGCRLRLADIYDKVEAAPDGFFPVLRNLSV